MLADKLHSGPYSHLSKKPDLQQEPIRQQVVLTSFLHALPHTNLLLWGIRRKTQMSMSTFSNSKQEETSQCQSVQQYLEADSQAPIGEHKGWCGQGTIGGLNSTSTTRCLSCLPMFFLRLTTREELS